MFKSLLIAIALLCPLTATYAQNPAPSGDKEVIKSKELERFNTEKFPEQVRMVSSSIYMIYIRKTSYEDLNQENMNKAINEHRGEYKNLELKWMARPTGDDRAFFLTAPFNSRDECEAQIPNLDHNKLEIDYVKCGDNGMLIKFKRSK